MKRVIQTFNLTLLAKSLSTSKNSEKLYERQLRCEIYRYAVVALAGQFYCFPDVGAIYGSRGYLDFYVDTDLKWGVELLCNTDSADLEEHFLRFDETIGTSKYRNIPMKSKAVLHFWYATNLESTKKFS